MAFGSHPWRTHVECKLSVTPRFMIRSNLTYFNTAAFNSAARRASMLAVIAAAILLSGCNPPPTAPAPSKPSLSGVALRLAVVDDPALVRAISILCGQWKDETGSELTVASLSDDELSATAASGKLGADAVIYAPRRLGWLVEKKIVRPIDCAALDDPQLDWADVFELVKSREVTWGTSVYAVPLGSPVLVCFYRDDLLRTLGQKPPRTWAEYQKLARLLQDGGPPVLVPTTGSAANAAADVARTANHAAWRGSVEPLAQGWAGISLLARAGAYARHPNHYSTLFNMQTMEPLVASPPFVRALEEMVAAARVAPSPALEDGPAEAWSALIAGHAGMALCWPASIAPDAAAEDATERAETPEIGCVALPGSVEMYNATVGKWEQRASPTSVPLLGIAGRVGSITTETTEPQTAMRLLSWLSSRKGIDLTTSTSADVAPFRSSQGLAPRSLTRSGLRVGEANQYAAVVAESLSATDCLVVPRIPGAERYLAALDDAVRQALKGAAEPQEALTAAAEQWRAITAELGLESQRAADRKSLRLDQ